MDTDTSMSTTPFSASWLPTVVLGSDSHTLQVLVGQSSWVLAVMICHITEIILPSGKHHVNYSVVLFLLKDINISEDGANSGS